jgi:tripartite-type tricarboxylate transporter receptor subunit TctC
VPFPPGGTTDVVARLVAQRFSESMKQSVVVDNRGGAGGALGADIVAKETADGGAGFARLGAWMRPGTGL